jgi:hypothetical protein
MLRQLSCASRKARAVRRPCRISVGGAAVDVDQICFGLASAPSYLGAICSLPSFGIAKFVAIV